MKHKILVADDGESIVVSVKKMFSECEVIGAGRYITKPFDIGEIRRGVSLIFDELEGKDKDEAPWKASE